MTWTWPSSGRFRLVLLNGVSSSGKLSIARQLLINLDRPSSTVHSRSLGSSMIEPPPLCRLLSCRSFWLLSWVRCHPGFEIFGPPGGAFGDRAAGHVVHEAQIERRISVGVLRSGQRRSSIEVFRDLRETPAAAAACRPAVQPVPYVAQSTARAQSCTRFSLARTPSALG